MSLLTRRRIAPDLGRQRMLPDQDRTLISRITMPQKGNWDRLIEKWAQRKVLRLVPLVRKLER